MTKPSGEKRAKRTKKLNRSRIAWTLPHRPNAKDNEVNFCERSGLILDEYRYRKQQEKTHGRAHLAPFETAEGFLKRQAYTLFYDLADSSDDKKMIKRLVTNYAYAPESPTFAQNRFHWALIAMFTVEGIAGGKKITAAKKKIWRLANEMLYARNNHVEARNLIGFLYQSACSKNISKLVKRRDPDPSLRVSRLSPTEN